MHVTESHGAAPNTLSSSGITLVFVTAQQHGREAGQLSARAMTWAAGCHGMPARHNSTHMTTDLPLHCRFLPTCTMRAKPRVETATLPVQLPSQPSQELCATLLQVLLKHLLYARGHIPYLYDQFLQQAIDDQQQLLEESESAVHRRRRRRPKKSDKRRVQFLQRAEALLESIVPGLFATSGPTRCFILLGSSTTKPREAYEVVMPAAAPAGGGEAAAGRDNYACRLLLRQLIISTPDLPEGTAAQRPSKVHVLVEGQAGQALPAGFVAKPSFRLSMRKGVHITFMLGAAALQQTQGQQQPQQEQGQQPQQQVGGDAMPLAPASAGQEAQHCGMGGVMVLGAVWLQSRWVLRGLKSSPDTAAMG